MFNVYLNGVDFLDQKHIGSINFNPKYPSILVINDMQYAIALLDRKNKTVHVNKITLSTKPEIQISDKWVCPYCNFIDEEANELYMDQDIIKCVMCGSTVEYERVVSYRVKPIKLSKIIIS